MLDMKKTFILTIIFLSALSLLQCQYARKILEDLDKQSSTEEDKNNKKSSSSSSEVKRSSSSEAEKSSSSEAKKTRKEAK